MKTFAVERPGAVRLAALPPLALYVHIPWCVRKCPYCDFNSHERSGELPEKAYVEKLLLDLEGHLPSVWGRRLTSVFIDGGALAAFDNVNIDLMYGLPGQSAAMARADITEAASAGTPHVSAYQLTIEPNTA